MITLNLLVAFALFTGACTKDEASDATTASTTTTTTTSSTTNGTATTYTNVAYATTSSAQVMDIYLPNGTGPFPVVVIIHGGAFMMGSKSGEAANCAALTAQGYAAVSIDYRLSGEAQFPARFRIARLPLDF